MGGPPEEGGAGWWANERRGCPGPELPLQVGQAPEKLAHGEVRIHAEVRPATMRGAALGGDLDPREAFVREAHLEMGGLRHNRAIHLITRNEIGSADAGVLLVRHAGDEQHPLNGAFASASAFAPPSMAARLPFMS